MAGLDAGSGFIVWAGIFGHGFCRYRAPAGYGFAQSFYQSFQVRHALPQSAYFFPQTTYF